MTQKVRKYNIIAKRSCFKLLCKGKVALHYHECSRYYTLVDLYRNFHHRSIFLLLDGTLVGSPRFLGLHHHIRPRNCKVPKDPLLQCIGHHGYIPSHCQCIIHRMIGDRLRLLESIPHLNSIRSSNIKYQNSCLLIENIFL